MVGSHQKCLNEVLLIRTHNICCGGEIINLIIIIILYMERLLYFFLDSLGEISVFIHLS